MNDPHEQSDQGKADLGPMTQQDARTLRYVYGILDRIPVRVIAPDGQEIEGGTQTVSGLIRCTIMIRNILYAHGAELPPKGDPDAVA